MLVHRRGRRRGVGAALLAAAERSALSAGKTLLVLDTVTGGDAERLYYRDVSARLALLALLGRTFWFCGALAFVTPRWAEFGSFKLKLAVKPLLSFRNLDSSIGSV